MSEFCIILIDHSTCITHNLLQLLLSKQMVKCPVTSTRSLFNPLLILLSQVCDANLEIC